MMRQPSPEPDPSLRSRERVLVLANGQSPGRGLWERLVAESSEVFCVDGGAGAALRLGARPSVIFGDLDSVTGKARREFACCEWVEMPDQDQPDLAKALDRLIKRGYHTISVAGALGKRTDHAVSNLGLLLKLRESVALTYHSEREDLFALQGHWGHHLEVGRRVSILPLYGASKVTAHGLKYPLRGEVLELGRFESLSNSALGTEVQIDADAPVLLCVGRTPSADIIFAPQPGR